MPNISDIAKFKSDLLKTASRKFVSVGQDLIPSDATQTFSKFFDFVLALDVSTLNLV